MIPSPDLEALLQRYFGYTEFRPLQREIIENTLSGRDSFVLMPTGGGKSMCYQLPALALPGLTVVVSPLIALMKDQVDNLVESGVAATYLNSSLSAAESEKRIREIREGKVKLVYVAPERLLTTGFVSFLKKQRVSLFAIDEAHCISMWGHDFREEYRGLQMLRETYPEVPIIALTATATPTVENDIIAQLRLRKVERFRASFDRPNLFYSVVPKKGISQLVEYVRSRNGDPGIVYCFSRDKSESVANALKLEGIRALPYHAGLEGHHRSKNQEKFVRDEVQVICATVAFGMGIDKSNIRFVAHFDLPKSISGYYQETGRAGRDGVQADCVLFFSLSDKAKILFLLDGKSDDERAKAMEELDHITSYAESHTCRRAALLAYFGERYIGDNCGACDNCTRETPISKVDATREAQMFLSCVIRAEEKFGVNHIVDILRGSESQKIQDFRHHRLPTYGIGKSIPKAVWTHYARELIREGYLVQDHQRFGVLLTTAKARTALRERAPVMLYPPTETQAKRSASNAEINRPQLVQELKTLRLRIAEAQSVPPYIIMTDATLIAISNELPLTPEDLLSVSGMGMSRTKRFGRDILSVVRQYVEGHPESQHKPIAPPPARKELSNSEYATIQLWKNGLTPSEIASQRDLATSTIFGHLARGVEIGEVKSIDEFVRPDKRHIIEQAFHELGTSPLSPVIERLADPELNFDVLKVARAYYEREKKARSGG